MQYTTGGHVATLPKSFHFLGVFVTVFGAICESRVLKETLINWGLNKPPPYSSNTCDRIEWTNSYIYENKSLWCNYLAKLSNTNTGSGSGTTSSGLLLLIV